MEHNVTVDGAGVLHLHQQPLRERDVAAGEIKHLLLQLKNPD